MEEYKQCIRCDKVLPLNAFYVARSGSKVYYYPMCRDCYKKLAEYKRKYAPATKICNTCHKEKPIKMFRHEVRSKDGYKTCCIECSNKRDAARYKKNSFSTCSICGKTKDKQQMSRAHLCRYPIGDKPVCRECYEKIKQDYRQKIAAQPKQCTVCGEWKPRADFSISYSNYDGLSHQCKTCVSIYCKNRYKKYKQ